MAQIENNNNSGLYFIVGALFVAVLIMGFIFVGNDDVTTLEPSAGVEEAADNVEDTTSEFNLKIDEDGVSGSSTQSSEN